MIIRGATREDFPLVLAVIRQYPETLMQIHLPKPEEFFVAEEDGQIIGCCALEVYSQRLAEVRSLAVVSEHQGKGIASKLVEACLQEAKRKGVYEVLTVTGATSLFERQGFSAFKKEKFALIKVLDESEA